VEEVTLADISSTLLDFSQWRLARCGLAATAINLKVAPLPSSAFDLITAMDVFEHMAY
jgi:cyclopropane fatty-acyl-phospholipid synthase-like methyltransferase